ncbi:MAG: RNA-guided endonuclease TnpB family protein [Patescibacteria group bacterium]|nr:RNA-guided endonuclease TnpB family protein [Patescibacteria group bacterium]MCL5095630.1 RNA-guided endonuclease TnpB family protein [Patescibacteria group bacterium]
MQLTTSYKFKILPTREQELFLEDYFSRFAKAVNFVARKIPAIEKDQQEIYEFIKEGLKGKCSYCSKSYQSCNNHKPEGKDRRDRNKICKKCKQNSLLNRKKKGKKELICQKCWNKKFSIRKILYATRGRKRGTYGDIKDATKLPGTEYALAFKRGADTIKSHKKQVKFVENQIFFKKRKLQEWKEVSKNKNLIFSELQERYKKNSLISRTLEKLRAEFKNKKTISARYVLPRQPNQKVNRFKHIIYKDNPSKGKSEVRIIREIQALEKTIEKLNKRLKEAKIKFDGKIVDLQNTAVKSINGNYIELSVDGKKENFPIALSNIKSKKGKEWLLKILKQIQKSKPVYPLLLKKNGKFYLSYPVKQEIKEPRIESNTHIMGIDRGVNQLAVTAIIDKPNGKPHDIKFYSGKELMSEKIKYQLIRKKFTGTKSVNKRRTKFGEKVLRISDYLLHNVSRQIVNETRRFVPVVIAMENLKITQGEKKPKTGKAVVEKKIRFKLSNFTYGKLQKLIEYKALQAGIPVRFVKPEYTSQECSICHKAGNRDRGFFRCTNPNCGHKMNADLNASINIANSLYKAL